MAIRKYLQIIILCLCVLSTGAYAQRVTDSGFGTIQDSSFRVIGHADGIPIKWAAWYFFFRN